MTEHDVLHTRLDNVEDKIGKMADALTKMADILSDFRIVDERVTQHSILIKELDRRMDEIEKKVPIYDLYVDKIKRIEYTMYGILTAAILGIIIA